MYLFRVVLSGSLGVFGVFVGFMVLFIGAHGVFQWLLYRQMSLVVVHSSMRRTDGPKKIQTLGFPKWRFSLVMLWPFVFLRLSRTGPLTNLLPWLEHEAKIESFRWVLLP